MNNEISYDDLKNRIKLILLKYFESDDHGNKSHYYNANYSA